MRLAYTVYTPRRGFARFFEEIQEERTLLRIELPNQRRSTLRYCARMARRWGAYQCLDEGLEPWLEAVSTRDFWQKRAAEIALQLLRQRGIPPERAVVGIIALHVSRAVQAAAEQLSDQVRALALEVPESCDLGDYLHARNGVSVLEGRGDVNLCFEPQPQEGCVNLGVRRPVIEFSPFLELRASDT